VLPRSVAAQIFGCLETYFPSRGIRARYASELPISMAVRSEAYLYDRLKVGIAGSCCLLCLLFVVLVAASPTSL
jgi:hypothetical protein